MRVLVVRPGPWFSVADVCRGWIKGLRENGCTVVDFNLDERLTFYEQIHLPTPEGEWRRAANNEQAMMLASKGLEAACFEFWPDVVLIVSGFFVPPAFYELVRVRGIKLVLLHTESPYEDDRQVQRAGFADLNIVNDPTNLERFREVAPAEYIPHAYDPDIHQPRQPKPELASDFCFVGTGYTNRIEFLEAVDWAGVDVALGGNWNWLDDDSPLREFVVHPIEHCIDNEDAADLYAASKASVNIYRTDAQRPELADGWSMGPREVELAACGTFFLREPRGESDMVLPMLPTFDSPGDFAEKLRWWLAHPEERHEAARLARAAVRARTFKSNAARLLSAL